MKILCLDSNSILNRAYYGIRPLTTKDGTNTNAIFGFLNILFRLIDEVNPDHVVCAFDVKSPTFRHKKYDEYKANRKGMPPELAEQFPIVKELLGVLGYSTIELAGYEADDILGTFAKCSRESKNECYIATGDRDSLQLISDYVTVLLSSSKQGKQQTIFCNKDYIMETYGITPKELIEVKALMGDSSDNIPGVAGVGEKTALKLISKYHNLQYIYDNIEEIEATKGVKTKLLKDKDNAFLSRELGEIFCDVPIDCDFSKYKIQPVDTNKAYSFLAKLEMFTFIKRLGLDGELPAYTYNKTGKECKVFYNPDNIKEKLDLLDELNIITQFDKNCPKSIGIVTKDEVLFIDEQHNNFIDILNTVLQDNRPKKTFDCKKLYLYGLENNVDVNNIVFDTVLSAYLLNPNSTNYDIKSMTGAYQVDDVNILGNVDEDKKDYIADIGKLFKLNSMLQKEIDEKEQNNLLCEIEIPLAKVLSSMQLDGISIDMQSLTTFGDDLKQKLSVLEESIYNYAGEEFNINSPKQLGEILFVKLGLPPRKKTKTGFSTGVEVLESLKNHHAIINEILSYRQLSKLNSTYVEGLSKVVKEDGKIHSHFNQTETRTGRISSTEPNMQNIPVRTPVGRELRKFFKAGEGNALIDADYSQIELRVLAHIADDKNMIEAFENGEDIHAKTASQVFDLPPLFVTDEMRSKAKAVNFGIVYGIGAFSLSKDINVSVKEADSYIKQYLDKFSGVKKYMDETISFAKQNGYVKTLYNRRRNLPEIKSSNHNMRAFGERVAMNMPIQGTAADIIKIAMIKVYNRLKKEELKAKLILQVHDELIIEAPEEEVTKASVILKQEMENAVDLKVKMIAQTNVGKTWYETK